MGRWSLIGWCGAFRFLGTERGKVSKGLLGEDKIEGKEREREVEDSH